MPFVNILVKQPEIGKKILFKYNHERKPYFAEEVYKGAMWYNEKTEWYEESPDPDKAAAIEYLTAQIPLLSDTTRKLSEQQKNTAFGVYAVREVVALELQKILDILNGKKP